MKVLQVLIFSILILGCCIKAEAQACCGLNFRLYVRDFEGEILKDAVVKLNLLQPEFYSDKNAYVGSSLVGCGSNYKTILKVKVKGYKEFARKIEITPGNQSFDLRLSKNGTKKEPVFEKITTIQGQVVDENIALIVDAIIELTEETGKKYFGKTDGNGRFDFNLPIGKYSAKVSQNGFKTLKLINFNIENTQSIYLNLKLKVRGCADCNGDILGENNGEDRKEEILDYQKIKEK